MKKTYDKKAAIKLINNYADQYHRIANECSNLAQEVKDLRLNNIINKEIIEAFYKTIPMKDKEDAYLIKTHEEIALLTRMNAKQTKEIQGLRDKTSYYEQIINKSISDYRESTESLQEKIFVLENALIKKDNMILMLNNKITKLQEEDDNYSNEEEGNSRFKNEIYIVDPSMRVNLVQDDLMLYKQAYDKALLKLKENNCIAEKYENRIDELRGEILKLQSKRYDRGWENGIIDLSSDKTKSSKSTSKPKGIGNISSLQTIQKEDIELLMQNDVGKKVMTIINKCIEDKNNEIDRLKSELKEQCAKYKKLNEENMSLLKTITDFKPTNQMPKQTNGNYSTKSNNKDSYADSYLNTNISMIGNTSGEEKRRNKHYNYLNKLHNRIALLSQSMDDPQITMKYLN